MAINMKGCLSSLLIGEIQIKMIMCYHYVFTRMVKIKGPDWTECWWDMDPMKLMYTDEECVKWSKYFCTDFGSFTTKLSIHLPSNPAISLLGIYPS